MELKIIFIKNISNRLFVLFLTLIIMIFKFLKQKYTIIQCLSKDDLNPNYIFHISAFTYSSLYYLSACMLLGMTPMLTKEMTLSLLAMENLTPCTAL